MANDIRSFEADLAKFGKKIGVNLATVQKRITFDMHGRITQRNPVDTGFSRASWDVTVGEPVTVAPPQPSEGQAIEPVDISAGIAAIDGTKPSFVSSAVHYLKYLEEGSSDQAPLGMVRITVAEVQAEIATYLTGLP